MGENGEKSPIATSLHTIIVFYINYPIFFSCIYLMATAIERSHEVQRGKVCVICYQKKADRLVSNGDTEVIQKYVIEGYTSSNSDFPNGICILCSVSLSKKWKDSNFVIPNLADNYNPGRKTSLRSLCYFLVLRHFAFSEGSFS